MWQPSYPSTPSSFLSLSLTLAGPATNLAQGRLGHFSYTKFNPSRGRRRETYFMKQPKFIPLTSYQEYPVDEMRRRAAEFYAEIGRRRTVREFSERPVPREIIENCLRAAGTAPNGANQQPWHFVVVTDPAIKQQIRV